MIMDEPGPAIFEADPADGYKLSFTAPDADEPGGRRTLMWFRCFEPEKMLGALAWLGLRQHLWAGWYEIAESEDGAALSRHLCAIAEEAAFEADGGTYLFETCHGATAELGDKATQVSLLLHLATGTVPVITHCFADTRSRAAFMDWLMTGSGGMGCVELAELALLEGRGALARKLDQIARERLTAAEAGKSRLPIPSDHETLPKGVADVMMMLRDQVGIPLAGLIELDLQAVHDVFAANVAPEDATHAERLVVVDDATVEVLDRVVTGEIARARPDRRIAESGYEGWTRRSDAVEELEADEHAPLPELDAALSRARDKDEVVLEDDDYRRVMTALNAAASSRPHGRSPTVGGGVTREQALEMARTAAKVHLAPHNKKPAHPRADPGFDVETANLFVGATMKAMTDHATADLAPNERFAMFGSVLAGEEYVGGTLARADGIDYVSITFDPGEEHRGARGVAVFEWSGGGLNAHTRCEPWMSADGSVFVLRPKGGNVCFGYDGRALVAIARTPEMDAAAGVARARAVIRSIAEKVHGSPLSRVVHRRPRQR